MPGRGQCRGRAGGGRRAGGRGRAGGQHARPVVIDRARPGARQAQRDRLPQWPDRAARRGAGDRDAGEPGVVGAGEVAGEQAELGLLDSASQMRYIDRMKTATLPSIRVEPEFRSTVESLLSESETLTEFVENAVRETVARRRNQAEFVS